MLPFLFLLLQVHSKLLIRSPPELVEELKNRYTGGYIKHSLGNFGDPPYGTTLHGQLKYDPTNPLGCEAFKENPFKDSTIGHPVLLVDRGDCFFVKKVANAEEVGATLVIVVDNVDEDVESQEMVDNGTSGDLVIPAVLISKGNGKLIKEYLDKGADVTLSMKFESNARGNSVDYVLWTSAESQVAREFLTEFADIGGSLPKKKATFTPHFVTYECEECRASGFTIDDPDCLAGGRYCATDPDQEGRLTGRDIVLENLNQLCIYNTYNSSKNYKEWFAYQEALPENCFNNNPSKCSDKAMRAAKISTKKINACVLNSAAGSLVLNENFLLRKENEAYQRDYQGTYPALVINARRYRGDLQLTPVLQALCSSYTDDKPSACKQVEPHSDPTKTETKKSKLGVILVAVLCVVLILVVCGAYRLFLKKKQSERMRAQVDTSVSQYVALSDIEMNQPSSPIK